VESKDRRDHRSGHQHRFALTQRQQTDRGRCSVVAVELTCEAASPTLLQKTVLRYAPTAKPAPEHPVSPLDRLHPRFDCLWVVVTARRRRRGTTGRAKRSEKDPVESSWGSAPFQALVFSSQAPPPPAAPALLLPPHGRRTTNGTIVARRRRRRRRQQDGPFARAGSIGWPFREEAAAGSAAGGTRGRASDGTSE
jgi:hypothetical protein